MAALSADARSAVTTSATGGGGVAAADAVVVGLVVAVDAEVVGGDALDLVGQSLRVPRAFGGNLRERGADCR